MNVAAGAPAGIYVRISSDRDDSREGVDRQLADCRSLVERAGMTEAGVYQDNDKSAYSGKPRPAYRKLLKDIQDGKVRVVVAWHSDRLYRNLDDLSEFVRVVKAADVQVATVNGGEFDLGTATGQMIATIIGSVAIQESAHKSERHKSAEVAMAKKGKAHGGRRPFGYEDDRVTIRPDEAELIREAARRVLAGESIYALAQDWRDQGVKTPAGNAWTNSALRKLLMSGRIAGIREHKGEEVAQAEWEPIISKGEHERFRARLPRPNFRGKGMGNRPYKYVLSGIARCGKCGARLVARPGSKRNKAGEKVRAMICTKDSHDAGACGEIRVVAQPMEDYVRDQLLIAIDGGALTRLLAGGQQQQLADVREQLADVDERLQRAATDYANAKVRPQEWSIINDTLNRKRAELKAQLDAIIGDTTLAEIPTPLDQETFDARPFDWRRQVIQAIVKEVRVKPQLPRKGRRPSFDPRRIEVIWKV